MKKILILLSLISFISAQVNLIPISVGTAGTAFTQTRGDDVIGWNPANLGYPDNPEFSMGFGIAPIVPFPAVDISNTSVSMKWFGDFLFSGQYLDDARKNLMLSAFDNGGLGLEPTVYAKVLGISTGSFAFTIGGELNTGINLPKSVMQLLMFGNRFEEEIILDDLDGSAQLVVPFALSFGSSLQIPYADISLDNHYFGFGLKFLYGVAHGEVESFEGGFTTFHDHIQGTGEGKVKHALDGFGFALDLGYAVQITDQIKAGISAQNLFGFINWKDKYAEMTEFTLDANITIDDSLTSGATNIFEDITSDSTYAIKGYRTSYPTYLTAGVEFDPIPQVGLMLNYRQYFKDEFNFDTAPRFSFATRLSPVKWFKFRAGVAVGGYEKFQVGFGIGFHGEHYNFDLGISQTGGMFNTARGLGISLGQKILF